MALKASLVISGDAAGATAALAATEQATARAEKATGDLGKAGGKAGADVAAGAATGAAALEKVERKADEAAAATKRTGKAGADVGAQIEAGAASAATSIGKIGLSAEQVMDRINGVGDAGRSIGAEIAGGVQPAEIAVGRVSAELQKITTVSASAGAAAATGLGAASQAADATAAAIGRTEAAASNAGARINASSQQAVTGLHQVEQAAERAAVANDNVGKRAEVSAGQAKAGYINLGRQMQDIAVSLQGGISIGTVLSQQGGQAADAVAQMGGKLSGVASFLSGPWGAAIIVGAGILLNQLVPALTSSSDKSDDLKKSLDEAASSADSFGNAQTLLGKIIDLNTGKFKTQNAVLVETIRLQAQASLLTAQADEKKARDAIGGLGQPSLFGDASLAFASSLSGGVGVAGQDFVGQSRSQTAPERQLSRDVLSGALDARGISARVDEMQKAGQLAGYTTEKIIALKQQLLTLPTALNNQKAAQQAIDAIDGKGLAADLKPYQAPAKARTGGGTGEANALGRAIADIKQAFPGARITSTTNHSRLTSSGRVSDHVLGRAIDFVPAGGVNSISFEDAKAAVEKAGINIRRNATGTLQFFGPGHGAKTRDDHKDHFHVGFSSAADPDKVSERSTNAAETLARKTAELKEFGQDAAARIANIREQFTEIPPQVQKTNQAMRQLDDLADDVEKRKPPNYAQIKTDLADARQAIEDDLNKPFREYQEQVQEAAAVDKLLIAGRTDEAEALKVALSLQKQMGPLSQEQLQTVLDTVGAERERSRELARQQEVMGDYLEATRDVRAQVEAIFTGQSKFSLKSFSAAFQKLDGKLLFQKIFGSAFDDLEDFIKGGNNPLDKATTNFTNSTQQAGSALDVLTQALLGAGGKISSGAAGGTGDSFNQAFDAAFGGDQTRPASTGAASGATVTAAATDAIVVVGKRLTSTSYADQLGGRIAGSLTSSLDGLFHSSFFSKLTPQISGAISGYATGGIVGAVAGVGKSLVKVDSTLGKAFGAIGAGAATGTAVAGIGKSLGVKTSTTGAQLGGAAGQLFFGPLGGLIGSIAGGILGGLFKKAKTGSATIGATDGNLAITGTGGNTASFKKAASGSADSVIDAVTKIADTLGGTVDASLGKVSIGIRDGKYRVDPTGGGATKTKKGAIDFGKDGEAAAISYAIADLVKDGVVTGVSAAVKKALTSSSDVDKAVAEAQKVQNLELAIGGIGAQLGKAFKDFERQAQERLRIAKQYGFDVVAVEKLNGEERVKLADQLLQQQVGSIQSLLTELTSGSLFEGSSVDLRQQLLGQLAGAKADVDAGKDGASDTYSALLQKFVEASKDAYATTGTYAADRASVVDQARDTIAKANQRIADAQAAATKSDPALTTTNAALDENNDQNAQIIAALGDQSAYLAQIAGSSASGLNYERLISLARIQ